LYSLEKTASTDLIQTAFGLVWLVRILFLKSTEPTQTACFFYLAVRMSFILKTKSNRTANTSNKYKVICLAELGLEIYLPQLLLLLNYLRKDITHHQTRFSVWNSTWTTACCHEFVSSFL